MIKSKIEARERALELSVACSNVLKCSGYVDVVELAAVFEKYLVGNTELPEVVDDNAHIKELFAIAQKRWINSVFIMMIGGQKLFKAVTLVL